MEPRSLPQLSGAPRAADHRREGILLLQVSRASPHSESVLPDPDSQMLSWKLIKDPALPTAVFHRESQAGLGGRLMQCHPCRGQGHLPLCHAAPALARGGMALQGQLLSPDLGGQRVLWGTAGKGKGGRDGELEAGQCWMGRGDPLWQGTGQGRAGDGPAQPRGRGHGCHGTCLALSSAQPLLPSGCPLSLPPSPCPECRSQ